LRVDVAHDVSSCRAARAGNGFLKRGGRSCVLGPVPDGAATRTTAIRTNVLAAFNIGTYISSTFPRAWIPLDADRRRSPGPSFSAADGGVVRRAADVSALAGQGRAVPVPGAGD